MESWSFRPGNGNDLPHIYSSWLRSFRSGGARQCRRSVFYPEYTQVIDWILSQDDSRTVVASLDCDPNVIFAYIVFQPGVIHYIHVKQDFRGMGIAKSLVQLPEVGVPSYYTHLTHDLKQILESHPSSNITFNPYLLFKNTKEDYGNED